MMETSNTLNSGMCRCCSSEGTFKDIKTKYHWMGEEEVYADMLTDCFDIKISTPENMDNGICEVCITQLRNAANFKKQVLHTEEQFKRRLQGQDIKNPIKLESVEDPNPIESDHLSDPDFSGPEYDVPIKVELEVKPKAKKRQAKPAASRAKKPKSEAETSSQRIASEAIIKKHVSKIRSGAALKEEVDDWFVTIDKDELETRLRRLKRDSLEDKREVHKHLKNIRNILLYTNATPIRRHTGLGYACAFCTTHFTLPQDLKQHTLENHDDSHIEKFMKGITLAGFAPKLDITSLHCELCDTDITELEQLLVHLKDEHDKEVYTDVNNHIMPFKFDNELLKCAVCGKEFEYFKKLQEHISFHYRNYLCSICSAPFMCKKSLQSHKNGHKQGEFPCSLCQKVFDTRTKKNDHERFVHIGNHKRSKCPYCSEKFTTHGKRVQHIAEQHGGKPLQLKCNACPLMFKSRDSLTRHTKRDHLMERRHQCSLCAMRFFHKTELTCHMVKHNGERQYGCDICRKAYARKKTLREHMRIHTDDKRFKCATCGQAFVQKCSWKSHMRSKHGELV